MKHTALLALTALLAVVAMAAPVGRAPARAAGLVVDDITDDANAGDKNPGDGACESWYNTCTLRAAVEEANALAGADTITFDGPMTVYLDSTQGFLYANSQIRLDASGVWDTANDRPGVSINGVDRAVTCLAIYAAGVEVYGLHIYNCNSAIGVYSSNNTIGGPLSGQRNVISGNDGYGIYLGTAAAHHNVVQGNWIGLTVDGDTAAPNHDGVVVADGASDNTIGGDTPAHGNYVSGNTAMGILVMHSGTDRNRIVANVVGMPAGGATPVPNGSTGVAIMNGPQNTVVGDTVRGNLIAGNDGDGVVISNANNNYVEQSLIFLNRYGVRIVNGSGNWIDGDTITANLNDGVYVDGAMATGNPIFANSIYGNGLKGIELVNGGNTELAAPVITAATHTGAAGTACAWCAVHVYSDAGDEGEIYHGFTTADGTGTWTWSAPLSGPNVTATSTDPCGLWRAGAAALSCNNTSEFSLPFALGPAHRVFLPMVTRSY